MATNSSAESLRGRDSGLRPSGGRGFGGPCSQLIGDARAAPVDVQSLERLDELISRAGHWAHGALLDADDVADERPAFSVNLKAPGQGVKSSQVKSSQGNQTWIDASEKARSKRRRARHSPHKTYTKHCQHEAVVSVARRAGTTNVPWSVAGVDTPWTLVYTAPTSVSSMFRFFDIHTSYSLRWCRVTCVLLSR